MTKRNYFYLKEVIGNTIYQEDSRVNPYMYGFISEDYKWVMKELSGSVEFGKTHVANEIHIPVNPFIRVSDYEELLNFIK